MSARPRPAILAAAAAALAGLAWALSGRLLPVTDAALAAQGARLRGAAVRAIEADARTLARVARHARGNAAVAEVVEGGGAEVRPGRLFRLLEAELPGGPGWGMAFYDKAGRAVGWARDAGDVESAADLSRPGLVASFHVTRCRIAWVLPWGTAADRRGTLVATRRYPTGVLGVDVSEMLGLPGGPTSVRLLLRAPARRDAVLAVASAEASPASSREDLARRRARPGALLAAAALALLGLLAGRGTTGLVAARLVLLLAVPAAGESGPWQLLFPGAALGLVATPVDILLTGIVALALLRSLLASRRRLPAVLAIAFAAAPWLLARAVALSRPDLFDDLGLVPESGALFLVRVGGLALVASGLGVAARSARPLSAATSRAAGLAGLALCGAGVAGGSGTAATAAALAGALLLAASLSRRAAAFRGDDVASRGATAVLLAAASCAAAAGGLAAGTETRLDRAIAASVAPERVESLARAWSGAVGTVAARSWLPAGPETVLSDLARALWIAGAVDGFPGTGDVLTIRDSAGAVVSSFGVLRPGSTARARVVPVAIPVPGLSARFTHLADPEEGEQDPVLAAVVERDAPDRVRVERLSFDAAGRSRTRGERNELPPAVLAEARARGEARTTMSGPDGLRRLWVRREESGFAGWAAPGVRSSATFGASLAATECGLVPLVLLLAGGAPPRRRGAGRLGAPLFSTFRARLVALVFLFGALPLAGSVAVVRIALERHAAGETGRRAHAILSEARRALPVESAPDERDLDRAARVVGTDLLLYRDGRLAFASRALPVAAEVARDRLAGSVAAALAEGRKEAVSPARRASTGTLRIVEAAEPLGTGGDALAVVIAEDETARVPVDALVLFTVAVALLAVGLGWSAALALSRPLDAVIASAERLGAGAEPETMARPVMSDLRRLVDAFEAMARRVRERTEMLAREREAAVGLLANLTAAVILFRERDGSVLLANPAADQLLPGADLPSRVSGLPPLRDALESSRAAARPWETRLTVALHGRERLVRIVVASLPPQEGDDRALLLLEDLTDFVRAERLTAWVDAARAIAHDVKNPLTPIRLAAERLLRLSARGAPPAAETLEGAAVSILRQVEILTDRFGRLSRFSDPGALERSSLDRDAIEALLAEVAADYGRGAAAVTTRVAPALPPIAADRALLRDALANFVVNALEALGERAGTVVLSAEPNGEAPGVRFACEDDGPGLPPELLPRLFEPAFSTKSRGSGMGLAATRRAIERQGGAVFASPRERGGLVVGFTIPSVS